VKAPASWDELLRHLADGPRENGSEALRQTAEFLTRALQDAGGKVDVFTFTAHPYRLRLVGVAMLLGCLAFAWLLRRGQAAAALLVLLSFTAVTLLETDFYRPIVGWLGAQEQQHVVATLPAVQPARHLLLTAHYDTKTDALDHVERAPVQFLGLPIVLFLVGTTVAALLSAARRRTSPLVERLTRAAVWLAVGYGIASFVSLSAGALIPSRSHGALDNGAACAVLVRLAERLNEAPRLARTDVSIVLFSAEEVGVEGSWVYANERFSTPPPQPTWVINLENIGSAPDLAVFGSETYGLRAYQPSPPLVALLDTVHRQERGKPLYVTPYPAGTDARSFLAHGIPAATVMSDPPGHPLPRHLHSRQDDRSRIDEASLDAVLEYLLAVVRSVEQQPI
jgi:acetylornithine deacetylase/succinyl-diaminopimelate desuccinylase-like protein